MKKTRETIIQEGLDKAIRKWRRDDCERGAYEYIDDFFATLKFPAGYTEEMEGLDDYLTVAYLNEENKIAFLSYQF